MLRPAGGTQILLSLKNLALRRNIWPAVGVLVWARRKSMRDLRQPGDGGPRSENDLLERLKAGDEEAMVELAETYSSKIYQLAFRYLRNKEDAEEVTQDVLFKVYRKVGAFRGDAALSSWIYRITFNAAMSRLRTAKYQRAQDEERQTFAAN